MSADAPVDMCARGMPQDSPQSRARPCKGAPHHHYRYLQLMVVVALLSPLSPHAALARVSADAVDSPSVSALCSMASAMAHRHFSMSLRRFQFARVGAHSSYCTETHFYARPLWARKRSPSRTPPRCWKREAPTRT